MLAGAAGLGAAPSARVKNTRGFIEVIAMDGPLVAYDLEATYGATHLPNRLFVWNVLTGGGALVSGTETAGADETSTGAGVREVAVAGRRVAWIVNTGGNTESEDELFTASLPHPQEVRLAQALRTGNVDCIVEGPAIGGLVGSGGLLAVNTWTEVAGDRQSCETTVTQASLRTIGAAATTSIATGAEARLAQSADLGRIAVRRADDEVAIYSQGGRLLRVLAPSSVKEVALRKDYLVVLTRTRTLEVFDAARGSLLYTRTVAADGAHLLDVHSGVAVYAVGRRVHAVALLTGKSAVVATAPHDVVGLELEAPGAVYAYNRWVGMNQVGNLAFLPLDRLRAAVS